MASGRRPAIGFAHRGARGRAPDNSLEGFALALALGAAGLESDVWLTADRVAVLDHDGRVSRTAGSGKRRAIGAFRRAELPLFIPSLEDLYAACGTNFDLSLDVLDPAAVDAVTGAARAAGAIERLWLCHPSIDQLASWRRRASQAHLVHSTSASGRRRDLAGHAADLRRAGIDAVNLRVNQWHSGMVEAYLSHELITLAWDAQSRRSLEWALSLGIGGVYSDHMEAMVAALATANAGRANAST